MRRLENQKLLDAVRQLVRERIYHLQTEPEPALPVPIQAFNPSTLHAQVYALSFSTFLIEWKLDRMITSSHPRFRVSTHDADLYSDASRNYEERGSHWEALAVPLLTVTVMSTVRETR